MWLGHVPWDRDIVSSQHQANNERVTVNENPNIPHPTPPQDKVEIWKSLAQMLNKDASLSQNIT